MEWFNDPQFLYLMGVLWIINGTVLYVVTVILKDVNKSSEEFKAADAITFVSWWIGLGHIGYAFFV